MCVVFFQKWEMCPYSWRQLFIGKNCVYLDVVFDDMIVKIKLQPEEFRILYFLIITLPSFSHALCKYPPDVHKGEVKDGVVQSIYIHTGCSEKLFFQEFSVFCNLSLTFNLISLCVVFTHNSRILNH